MAHSGKVGILSEELMALPSGKATGLYMVELPLSKQSIIAIKMIQTEKSDECNSHSRTDMTSSAIYLVILVMKTATSL